MNTPKKTMANGLTCFSLRAGHKLGVRVVNGTMYKLLSAKKGNILTRILSPRFARRSLRALLYAKRSDRRADNRKSSYPKVYGLIGLQAQYAHPGWVSSITLRELEARKARRGMSQNTYSSLPFSRIVGLPDGSASATLKDFQNRRKGKERQ
jgi:hypothetical protein